MESNDRARLNEVEKLLEKAILKLGTVVIDDSDELQRIERVLEETHNELDSWLQNNDTI